MTDTTSTRKRKSAPSPPLDPFVSNRYHYGMLLGVADLEADQGYHRGKTWLHSAWLHGAGSVWGLRVDLAQDGNLVVRAGLAIDHRGRELWIRRDECLNIGRWFDSLDKEAQGAAERSGDTLTFTAHVRLCADQCLDRPVPSIAEPCGDGNSEAAFSRTVERARPELEIGEPPPAAHLPYHRLRALAGDQDEVEGPSETPKQAPTDGECGEAKPSPSTAPTSPDDGCPPSQHDSDAASDACAERWHHAAVHDSMALHPGKDDRPWPPLGDDDCIVLALLEVRMTRTGDEWSVETSTTIDNTVRAVHVPTTVAQSLLWHALCCCEDDSSGQEDGCAEDREQATSPKGKTSLTSAAVPTAGEIQPTGEQFRVDPGKVECDGRTIVVAFTRPAAGASIKTRAFLVAVLDAEQWRPIAVDSAGPADDGRSVRLHLAESVDGRRTRIIVRGTGEHPVVSRDFSPLQGCIGDPHTSSGCDAAIMRDLSDVTPPSAN